MTRWMTTFLLLGLPLSEAVQEVKGQDLQKVLERADKLLDEAKAAYEEARSKNSIEGFVDAAFKLEDARIKYLVLQEVGSADQQKIGADRLRAAGQLNKLINDAKAAAARPSEAPAEAPPAEAPQRAPIPDAAKQRDAERLIQELFKDEYAKKGPVERKALARLLLDQAAKGQDDAASIWVLCREAQDLATQAADVALAMEAIDALVRAIDVDGLPMRSAALASLAKEAKTPEECLAVTEALLKVGEDLVAADQVDAADKAVTLAVAISRKTGNPLLAARAADRSTIVADAKALYAAMKAVLEAQSRNPDDPGANLEIGRYHCLAKGNWDLGLRYLAKSSDPAFKAAAERELASLAKASDRVAAADGWFDLGEREKIPSRKSRLLAHAKELYESAMPAATALMRVKIEKRLDGLASNPARRAGNAPGGLIGHWRFDEASGGIAADSSGSGHTGKAAGNTQWTAGKVNGALKLGSGKSWVEVADAEDLRLTGDLTLALWVRKDAEAGDWVCLVGKGDADQRNYGLWLEPDGPRVLYQELSGSSGVNHYSTKPLPIGVWTHLAVTVEGNSIRLFFNGVEDTAGTRPGRPPTPAAPLGIGWACKHASLTGALDDVRVYNRALSAAEILGLLKPDADAKAPAGAPKPGKPAVEPVNAKAIAYLKSQVPGLRPSQHVGRNMYHDELVLLAFVAAGVPLDDPDVQRLFRGMVERKLENVYDVSMQAVILEEIDRARYQWRIQKCAQFLVDNQLPNGQWSYGLPSVAAEQMPQGDASLTLVRPLGVRSRITRRLQVRKTADGGDGGDNSNSAYAAMGLRACFDAGIAMPTGTLSLGEKAWRQSRKSGADAGWCYSAHADHKSYGSMTAYGVASLSIYDYMKGGARSWKADRDVNEGLNWLAKNYSVKHHPGPYEHAQFAMNSMHQFYYYLYALERAATLYGTDSIGTNKWHAEGSKHLLSLQNPDGSWPGGVVDTCFAVLFLAKATRPLEPAAGGK